MSISSYTRHVSGKGQTPQSAPIPGSNQLSNSAGGFAWRTEDWVQLDRFLVLGTLGGTYYIGEQQLTAANAQLLVQLIARDGVRVVKRIVEISEAGRAVKNDPAIFALALCLTHATGAALAAAKAAAPKVCRTGTHVFALAQAVNDLRGWGRSARSVFQQWYETKPARDLAYQMVKYQQREGMSHRDVLRLSHPQGATLAHRALYQYAVKRNGVQTSVLGRDGTRSEFDWKVELPLVWAHEEAKRAVSPGEIVRLIVDYGLPRESVPTQFLTAPEVWDALLTNSLPLHAMVRNLGNMTEIGFLQPGSEAAATVAGRLLDADYIRKSRLHPLAILVALRTYQRGRGVKGSKAWQPVGKIVDALDEAFYLSFGNVEPTGKRFKLALDVSGSMTAAFCSGAQGILTCRDASAAMALITARTESNCDIVGFSTTLMRLAISSRQRLDDVVNHITGLPFSGTDCALPMLQAQEEKQAVDAFLVYTDSETWFGSIHPAQALVKYRQALGLPARLVVVGMQANPFSIADPNDPGMLDVCGFDTATPQAIGEFVKL